MCIRDRVKAIALLWEKPLIALLHSPLKGRWEKRQEGGNSLTCPKDTAGLQLRGCGGESSDEEVNREPLPPEHQSGEEYSTVTSSTRGNIHTTVWEILMLRALHQGHRHLRCVASMYPASDEWLPLLLVTLRCPPTVAG